MRLLLSFFALVSVMLPVAQGEAAVVMVYRGTNPNPFPLEPPYFGSSDFDMNADGIADFRFTNSPFTSDMKGFGSNRVLGVSEIPPSIGSNVLPVAPGAIIGANTTFPIGQ